VNRSPEVSSKAPQEPIRTRRVYYIGGFDPRGAVYYHRLYEEEAAKQGGNIGVHIEVGPRFKVAPHQDCWTIKSEWHGHTTTTDYCFLSWEDIVREYWRPGIFSLLLTTIKGYIRFARCGALGRIRTNYRGPFYSGLYPIAFLALVAACSLVAGGTIAVMLANSGLYAIPACGLGLVVLAMCFRYGMKLADRLGVLWLLKTYLFVYNLGESLPHGLKERI